MPEFKLKKMFSKSRSSSRHRMDSDGGDGGSSNMNGGGPMAHPGTSPEHHGPGTSSSRYGSRSSLSGGSVSGNGSKSNSLERRSRTGSDGGISGISGMDSGHSSMNSPLNLPMEHLQSFNATYGGGQRTYLDSLSIPRQLSNQGPSKSALSPTHHARSHFSHSQHARTNSASSLSTTALRDRSIDRLERDVVYSTDRSLDRHLDRMQNLSVAIDNQRERNQRTYNRDRSLDREYPHMGARSLEREHSSVPRSRSSDRSGEMNYPMPPFITSSPSPQDYRNNLIFELQCQVTELHQECAKLQKEVEVARDKLGSSMNSIKTFWSPELKKERAMRKEESAKCNMLNEQLKVTQAELKRHRDLVHDLGSKFSTGEGAEVIAAANASELESLRNEKESQGKEMLILRRTVDELEIRIETQKQTLAARDASIKTLLDMLQGKGLPVNQLEDDRRELENLQSQVAHDATKIRQLEEAMDARDAEISKLTEESARLRGSTDASSLSVDLSASSSSSHTLNAMIEAKDARIAALEKEVQSLEDKLLKSKEELTMDDRRDLSKDSPGVKDRQQRQELQGLKDEMSRKEREYASLQLQADTLKRQHEETLHHVTVLKEQLAAKEKQTTMLQADIEGLQERLKNKDGTIERKSKESQAVASDKRRLETELAELKDQLDTKERKVTVLQRKVETQEDLIKEKEEMLSQVKSRQMFTDSTDSAVSSLEESITEKDRQIERMKEIILERVQQLQRLREMREQSDRDHQEELDLYMKTNQDLKTQMEAMHFELTAKQTELCELREEAAELRAQKFQADAKMRQLEAAVQEQDAPSGKELSSTEMQTDPTQDVAELWSSAAESTTTGEGPQVNGEEDAAPPAPNLLEELQKKVAELEEDKKEKEGQITEMQDVIKEYRQKMGTLKRNQQTEKKKNAQLLEEARKREDSFTDDASQLSTTIEQKNERIEELEEALRESVRITAQREMDMVELQSQIDSSKSAMEEMRKEVEGMQASSREYTSKLATLTRQLEDRDAKLKRMGSERQKHLEEVYEMKQEAVQAAISEKDSTIALLEMTSTKKQRNLEEIEQLTHEKHRLQATLRDVTQNLMKLREGGENAAAGSNQTTPTSTTTPTTTVSTAVLGSSSKGKKTVAQRLRNAPPEQVVRVIRKLEHSKKRLRTLVEKLQTVCNDTDPSLLEGVSSPVMGPSVDFANLRSLSLEQLLLEALRSEDESRSLQGQANFMLQRLGTRAPELLQAFLAILDSSDTDSCTSCQSN